MTRKSILAKGLAETLTTTRDAYLAPTTWTDIFMGADARKRRVGVQAASGLVDTIAAVLKGAAK